MTARPQAMTRGEVRVSKSGRTGSFRGSGSGFKRVSRLIRAINSRKVMSMRCR